MKKIIKGKVYDTSTAQNMGEWSNGYSYGDWHYEEETLFRKRTGEFFLFGKGGPLSKYRERVGSNSWTGGEQITPLTWDEATEWSEVHLDADEYESIFGEVAEDDSRAFLNTCMPTSCVERAKRAASKMGISLSAYIEYLINKETDT